MNFEWLPSFYHLPFCASSRLLRDEEDGRGDKEPVPPPSRLSFVALSPSLLVTHDYALSTADQVLLFACNSMTISDNLCWAPSVVRTLSFDCVFYIWLAYTDFPSPPLFACCFYIYQCQEVVLYSAYVYTAYSDVLINTHLELYCSQQLKYKELTVCTFQIIGEYAVLNCFHNQHLRTSVKK